MDDYTDINARVIDKWADNGWEWSIPVSHEVLADAKNGKWDVLLTPTIPVPHEWFSPIFRQNRLNGVKPGGVLLSGMDNGFNFIVEDFTVRPLVIANKLPYNPLKNPKHIKHALVEDGWEDRVYGQ